MRDLLAVVSLMGKETRLFLGNTGVTEDCIFIIEEDLLSTSSVIRRTSPPLSNKPLPPILLEHGVIINDYEYA
jgi:hypothetical protein